MISVAPFRQPCTLLDQKSMLSNAVGANEIDNLFPALDTDGSGGIDESGLQRVATNAVEGARSWLREWRGVQS